MTERRRILIVNRHYWPDVVTYGQMLRHIAARWVADGHQVDVLAAIPSYRPESGLSAPRREVDMGVAIKRVQLFRFKRMGTAARLINSLPFFLGLIWHVVGRRFAVGPYHYVLASTNPPIVEAMLVRLLCAMFGGRLLYHVQDIHPEVEVSAGVLASGRILDRLLRRVDAGIVKSAAACVTLSDDMRHQILSRYRSASSYPEIHIINNFSFELDETATLPKDLVRDRRQFRLIFAGNIGFFQGLEEIVVAIRLLGDLPDFELLFVGNGVAVAELNSLAGPLLGSKVKFLPFQPMSVAHALVEDADLALISLKPGVIRLAYPSKTMTYVATGTPVLAIVEEDSELARVISQNELGFVAAQGNPERLAATIRDAYKRRAELDAKRPERRSTGAKLFRQQQALDAWSALITSLER